MLRSLSFLCALALSTPAQAAAPRCLAGQYDGGATEIASRLDLSPDGRFSYGLSYGALDEQAQGRWESDGEKVFLVGDPVTPPRFALVSETPAEAGAFRLHLDLPDGISPQYFNALLVLSDGRTVGSPLGFDDWVLPLEDHESVVTVKFQLPVLNLESERIALTSGKASEARFTFLPNDLGKAAFEREPLAIDGRDLVLDRHDRIIRFRPERGGC